MSETIGLYIEYTLPDNFEFERATILYITSIGGRTKGVGTTANRNNGEVTKDFEFVIPNNKFWEAIETLRGYRVEHGVNAFLHA